METIADGKVIIEIDAESKGFEKGLDSVKQTASQLAGKELKSVETAASAISDALKDTASAASEAGRICESSLGGAESVLKDTASAATAAAEAVQDVSEEAGSTEIATLEREISDTNTAIKKETDELQSLNGTLELTEEKWVSAGASVSGFGEKLSSIGSTLTKSITAPVIAAGTAAVKFASDYEENLNKVDVSFKDSAEEVKAWAKTATQQFGMSESAALEATSLFGDMGTSMGLTTKEAANMSTELAGLAGDLSSFKNIDIEQAMNALKGVFTGETESLKTLGVVMTETNLKAFADDMGLVYDSMSQAEQVTLRYKYVLSQTKNAQGDYARTSDGTANSIRTLKAEASNLAAAFGEELLPEITPLIQKATELVRRFGELDEGTKQNIIQAGLFAAATGPVFTGVGKVTEGVGFAIEKVGTFSNALSGGGGLASALTTTLGIGGAAGLAIAGVATLTAVGVGLGTAIYNATDPVVQIKKHLENLAEAQEHLSDAENITELCTRYEELRAKTADTSLSSEELSAVQAELAEVRAALNDATNGAISAEGGYDDALDETVGIQKELAEAEKNRANQEIYTQLVKGANDYQKSLQKQKDKQYEISIAEERVERGTERLSAAVEQYSAEMSASGKATFSTKLEMDDAATCANGARKSYDALVAELSEMQAATTEYEQSLISLVQDGFLSAADASAILGISEDALGRRMTTYWNETHQASTRTQALAGEHLEAAKAAQEQADAESEATSAIWDIASAAVDAKCSGDDLRGAYEELSSQLDSLRENGDATAIMLAEQKLAELELMATNQELAQSYSGYVTAADNAGISISTLSGWLIDNGLTAEEWGSRVDGATDGVINSFAELDTSLDMDLTTMAANLESNIAAYGNWNSNIQTLMAAAVATGNQSAVDFVTYMENMGIGAADQVQAMVDNIDWTMATFPPLMSDAANAGMTEVYNEVEGSKTNVADATTDVMQEGVVGVIENTDTTSAALGIGDDIASGIQSQAGEVESAAQGLVDAVNSTMSDAGSQFKSSGTSAANEIRAGLLSQKSSVTTAAKTLATAVTTAWSGTSGQFKQSGSNAGTQIKIGLLLQKSSITTAAQAGADSVNAIWANYAGLFRSSGSAASQALAGGISGGRGSVTSAAYAVAYGALSAAQIGGWYDVGYNMSAGIAWGVRGGSYLITSAARSAAYAALYSAKAALGIHSPSRVFEEQVGQMIPTGIAIGIQDETQTLTKSMDNATDALLEKARAAVRPAVDNVATSYVTNNTVYNNGGSGSGTIVIETPVYLDGREVARGTAKYTGRRMAYLEGL